MKSRPSPPLRASSSPMRPGAAELMATSRDATVRKAAPRDAAAVDTTGS